MKSVGVRIFNDPRNSTFPPIISEVFLLDGSDLEMFRVDAFNSIDLESLTDFKLELPYPNDTNYKVELLTQVLEIMGFKIEYDDFYKGSSDQLSCLVIPPPAISKKASGDFFDKSRELEFALTAFLDEIRGINDPEKLDSRIRHLEIYAMDIKKFIDGSHHSEPLPVPGEMAEGFYDRLLRIEWSKVSDQANKWVQTIIKILEAGFRSGL